MSAVFLDTGPLGMASNPKSTPENDACQQWVKDLVTAGVRVFVPEIADYEIRRELLRADKTEGIKRLDILKAALEYLPLTTEAMLLASELWAKARKEGHPTAQDKALDGDVILSAQALSAGLPVSEIVVATVNVDHLIRFLPAKNWKDITP